jgi:mannan polymerase II complex MNN10 subunit
VVGMSLSRSPSPVPGGGWSSPGLNINDSGRSTPARTFSASNGTPAMWESARMKNNMAGSSYPSFSTQNQGFFTRHMRRISSSLPRFGKNGGADSHYYVEKDKYIQPQAGQWSLENVPLLGWITRTLARFNIFSRLHKKWRLRALLAFFILLAVIIFYNSRGSQLVLSQT